MLLEADSIAAQVEPTEMTWPGTDVDESRRRHKVTGGAWIWAERGVVRPFGDALWHFLTAESLVRCPMGARTARRDSGEIM